MRGALRKAEGTVSYQKLVSISCGKQRCRQDENVHCQFIHLKNTRYHCRFYDDKLQSYQGELLRLPECLVEFKDG